MKNTPYRKKYNNGILINPIKGIYPSGASDRAARRFKKIRLMNNRPLNKSRQNRQVINSDKPGYFKMIIHGVSIIATRIKRK